ncbi:hypothetical protein BH23GEM4_BH23GEM4_08500 [soil metagenome]
MVYVFGPESEESGVNETLERFHGLLTGSNGGEVVELDHWGRRELAYPIGDHTSGYYVVAHVTADAEALPEFERALKLDDSVLRYLVVVNEAGLPTTPAPEDPADGDEDDDDDGED